MTGAPTELSALRSTVPAPRVDPEMRAYWEAAGLSRLLVTSCHSCDAVIWHPRPFCPVCSSLDVGWTEASGFGVIYSYTVVRKGGEAEYAAQMPYVLAYVELDEGPRMMTNIVDVDLPSLAIGLRVRAVFHAVGDGTALTRFTRAEPVKGAP
jgi:uncharacterized protein